MEKQMKKALKIIKNLQEENDNLFREISLLKVHIHKLEAPKKLLYQEKYSINPILKQADEAMKRNVAKIRKECEKYAKQKQS